MESSFSTPLIECLKYTTDIDEIIIFVPSNSLKVGSESFSIAYSSYKISYRFTTKIISSALTKISLPRNKLEIVHEFLLKERECRKYKEYCNSLFDLNFDSSIIDSPNGNNEFGNEVNEVDEEKFSNLTKEKSEENVSCLGLRRVEDKIDKEIWKEQLRIEKRDSMRMRIEVGKVYGGLCRSGVMIYDIGLNSETFLQFPDGEIKYILADNSSELSSKIDKEISQFYLRTIQEYLTALSRKQKPKFMMEPTIKTENYLVFKELNPYRNTSIKFGNNCLILFPDQTIKLLGFPNKENIDEAVLKKKYEDQIALGLEGRKLYFNCCSGVEKIEDHSILVYDFPLFQKLYIVGYNYGRNLLIDREHLPRYLETGKYDHSNLSEIYCF